MHTGFGPNMQMYPWPDCSVMMQGQCPMMVYMAGPYMMPMQYPMAGGYMGKPGTSVPRSPEVEGVAETEDKVEKSQEDILGEGNFDGSPYDVSEQYRGFPWLIPLLFLPFFFPPAPPPQPAYYYNYDYYYYGR